MPYLIFLLILSIMTIASLTTIPDKATIPRNAVKEKGRPRIISPNITPIMASGRLKRIINGCLNELNCKTKIIEIRITAKIIDKNISLKDC